GDEDRRYPLAPHRRHRYHHWPAPDGDRVTRGVVHSAHHRRGGARVAELAAGAHGAGDRTRRRLAEPHLCAPGASDLSLAPEGRGADRWPRWRDLFRYS